MQTFLQSRKLSHDNIIKLDNYTWFGHNRSELHRNAQRGSGGVGLLTKNCVLAHYDNNVLDKSIYGLFLIELVNRQTSAHYLIFTCYLPPENFVWRRDSSTFFAHILSLIYLHSNDDFILLAGALTLHFYKLSQWLTVTGKPNKRLIIFIAHCVLL